MSSRVIRSHGGSQALQDYLASMLAAELIYPSREMYLIFPYMSNSPLFDNRANPYTALIPFAKGATIYLADVLEALVSKQCAVRIICDPKRPETQPLIAALQGKAEFRCLHDNHDKMLVTENVYLHGSMNFTYRGIYINRESIRVTNDASEISHALLAARARWEEALEI
jgi:hypothetical protein